MTQRHTSKQTASNSEKQREAADIVVGKKKRKHKHGSSSSSSSSSRIAPPAHTSSNPTPEQKHILKFLLLSPIFFFVVSLHSKATRTRLKQRLSNKQQGVIIYFLAFLSIRLFSFSQSPSSPSRLGRFFLVFLSLRFVSLS